MSKQRERYTTAEDKTIREFAGKKTAEEIGLIIGRTKDSIHNRVQLLRLDGRIRGEDHHASKLSNLQSQMLLVLYQAGFTVNEIHKAAFDHVAISTVNDVASARTHQEVII